MIFSFALPSLVIRSAGEPQLPTSTALLRTAAWSCSAAPCEMMGKEAEKDEETSIPLRIGKVACLPVTPRIWRVWGGGRLLGQTCAPREQQ